MIRSFSLDVRLIVNIIIRVLFVITPKSECSHSEDSADKNGFAVFVLSFGATSR